LRIMRLGACLALACCGLGVTCIPTKARNMTRSEKVTVERALRDVQHTRELQALDNLRQRIRERDWTGYDRIGRRRSPWP
jgi:hypothetical protein